MTQREAVYTAVVAVLGEITGAVVLDSAQKKAVHAKVEQLFLSGVVDLKGSRDSVWLRKYIPGLVNNWCRKDPLLNGNTKYKTKNPGSRTGSGDEMLKQMKLLLAATTDPTNRAEIQAAIDARIEELKPKPQPINASILPESLRRLVPTAVAPIIRKAEDIEESDEVETAAE